MKHWNLSDVLADAFVEIAEILSARGDDYKAIRPAIDDMLANMESVRAYLDTSPELLDRPN